MNYQITVAGADQAFAAATNENILEAGLRAGLPLPYGCRGGSCGACRATLLSGSVSYPETPTALSDVERAAGQVLLCQARAAGDLTVKINTETEALASGGQAVRTLPARVINLHRLAPDVMRLYLKLPPTEQLRYRAGQYIDILLRNGQRRSFSLANPPHADAYLELHVRHLFGGAFSSFVFDGMQEKAILRIEGPLGGFYLRRDSQRPLLMLAGGTGFAPIKAILEDAFHDGFHRPVHFYWGARSRRDLYQNDLPEGWAEQQPTLRYTPVLSAPAAADDWQGRTGFVHAAAAADYPNLSQHQVYMAGPPAMIEAAKAAFFAQGLDPQQLFYDSFELAVA